MNSWVNKPFHEVFNSKELALLTTILGEHIIETVPTDGNFYILHEKLSTLTIASVKHENGESNARPS